MEEPNIYCSPNDDKIKTRNFLVFLTKCAFYTTIFDHISNPIKFLIVDAEIIKFLTKNVILFLFLRAKRFIFHPVISVIYLKNHWNGKKSKKLFSWISKRSLDECNNSIELLRYEQTNRVPAKTYTSVMHRHRTGCCSTLIYALFRPCIYSLFMSWSMDVNRPRSVSGQKVKALAVVRSCACDTKVPIRFYETKELDAHARTHRHSSRYNNTL